MMPFFGSAHWHGLRRDSIPLTALELLMLAFFIRLACMDGQNIRGAWRSRKWHPTHAKVIDIKDNSFVIDGANQYYGSYTTKYKESLYGFRYTVGGNEHISHRYSFGGHVDQTEANFSVGDAVVIYYDPADPRKAVVKRGLTASLFLMPLLAVSTLGVIVWQYI